MINEKQHSTGQREGNRNLQCPNLISSCVSLRLSGLAADYVLSQSVSGRWRECEGSPRDLLEKKLMRHRERKLAREEEKEHCCLSLRSVFWVHATSLFVSRVRIPCGESPSAQPPLLLSHYSTYRHPNGIYWHYSCRLFFLFGPV